MLLQYNYYVISWRLGNGYFKEYYVYCSEEDLLDRVRDLTKRVIDKEDEEIIDVFIYEHIKRLSVDELFSQEMILCESMYQAKKYQTRL